MDIYIYVYARAGCGATTYIMLCVTFFTRDDICVARVGISRVYDVRVMSSKCLEVGIHDRERLQACFGSFMRGLVTSPRCQSVCRRATRSYLTLKVPNGEAHIPAYVRSVSVRPDERLELYER